MKHLWLVALLLPFLLISSLQAQDGRSFAIGGAATAAPMDLFSFYWNPACLAMPNGSPSGWTVGSGFSILDSSNAGSPILQFTPSNAQSSSSDPVNRQQQIFGTFGVGYTSVAGGLLYDQRLNYSASQGSLAFFHDRDNNSLGTGPYALNYLQTTQQVGTLIASYGTQIPLGAIPFTAIGASLKYHDGVQYQQTQLTGSFTQGSSAGYTYTKTTSSSGLGLSVDGGFLVKVSDALSTGMMFQNLQSNFSWQAQQQSYSLNSGTGAETLLGAASSVTIQSPYPYATKWGVLIDPPGKDILLEGEVSWSQQQTHWRFGLERYYPQNFIAVRFGTFYDDISQSQLWAFGFGYEKPFLSLDLSFVTRSLPEIQNSIALGGAASAIVRF